MSGVKLLGGEAVVMSGVKLLGELLKEEQEPFVLESFLQVKRAEVLLGKQHRKGTTLGQLLVRRPVMRAVAGAPLEGGEICDSSCSSSCSSRSSLVSKPKGSRPCSPSMGAVSRQHGLLRKLSFLRLVSPYFPERTTLSVLLEAAAGRVDGKRRKKRTQKQRRKEWQERKKAGDGDDDKVGGGSGGSVRCLVSSSLAKRKRVGRRDADEQQAASVSMGDVVKWERKARETAVTAAGKGVRRWEEQRAAGAPSSSNGKEVLDERCHVDILENGFLVCCANKSARSCCSGSEACSSWAGTTSGHPSGWCLPRSSLSLSSSSSCDNPRAGKLDEMESPWSSPTSRLQRQVAKQEEEEEEGGGLEDGSRLLSVVGEVDDDEAEAGGLAASNGTVVVLEQLCSNNNNNNNNNNPAPQQQQQQQRPCCSCVVVEAEKDQQLSPVSVLEPAAAPFDEEAEEDHHRRRHRNSCRGHEGIGRGGEKEAEEEVDDDGSIVVGDDEVLLQRSLTIVLDSRKQILGKLTRFGTLAAAGILDPVNLDQTFAAFRQNQHDHCRCSSLNQRNLVVHHSGDDEQQQQQQQLQPTHLLRLCTDHAHSSDATTTTRYCDAAPDPPASRPANNNNFLVRACWEDTPDVSSDTTTIDMMVEADLRLEGPAATAEWRGDTHTLQASQLAVGIEASILAFLLHEFYQDM